MLRIIIQKEISEYIKSFYFTLACFICVILIPLVVFLSLEDYKERLANYSESLAEDDLYSGLVTQIKWESGYSEYRGKDVPKGGVPKKPANLSVLAMGLENEMSGPTKIKDRWREIIQGKRQSRNLLNALFQTPDFLYIVKVALSLLALLFAFDAINGEKSAGTLRLILSNRVPRDTLLLGKIIGRLAILYLPFLLGTLLGMLLIILSSSIQMQSSDWLRIGLIVATSMIYALFFFLLGLFISSLTRKPSLALVISLFVWVSLVAIIPSFTLMLAKGIRPVPSNASVAAQRYNRGVSIVTEAQQKDPRGSYRDNIPYHNEIEYDITAELIRMDQGQHSKQVRFYDLVKTIGRLSPVFSLVQIATGLAGTSIDDFLHYRQYWFDQRSHRLEYEYANVGVFLSFLEGKSNRIGGRLIPEEVATKYRQENSSWKRYLVKNLESGRLTPDTKIEIDPVGPIPPFPFGKRSLGLVVRSSVWDVALLLFFSVLFFMLSTIALNRYDVR